MKPPSPPFDLEAETMKLLAVLSPCAQYVVVASDRYSGKFKCEVTVPAVQLAPFVNHLTQTTLGGSRESQVARVAMPRWLAKASVNDGKTTYLSPAFVDIIESYVLNFIKDDIADVYCKECRKIINTVDLSTRNRRGSGPWSEWTDAWHCQNGHLLYTEDHELHMMRRREP
jgi:hypothetical protein